MEIVVSGTSMEHEVLENRLLELLDPSTTPEKALQSLSSPCLYPLTYNIDDVKPVVIFLAYIRFIITRRTEACVDSIWEDILRNTLEYSRQFSQCSSYFNQHTLQPALRGFGHGSDKLFDLKMYNRIVPTVYPQVTTWLEKALSSPSKCPNPYIRLELFRLIRLLSGVYLSREACRYAMCNTFIDTICKINPHHIYPCGNTFKIIFNATDLDHVISEIKDPLKKRVSENLMGQLEDNNEVIDKSDETKFISHCIQIIGVFAVMAGSNTDQINKFTELFHCCQVFKKGIGRLVSLRDHLPGTPLYMQFQHLITSRPPFCDYVIGTVCDLTTAITNYEPGDIKQMLMIFRDIIVQEQALYNKTYKLPSLLLSRQIEGPTLIHQHSLLLKSLGKEDVDGTSDSDRWSLIEHKLQAYIRNGCIIFENNDSEVDQYEDDSSYDSEYDSSSDGMMYFTSKDYRFYGSSRHDKIYDSPSDNSE